MRYQIIGSIVGVLATAALCAYFSFGLRAPELCQLPFGPVLAAAGFFIGERFDKKRNEGIAK